MPPTPFISTHLSNCFQPSDTGNTIWSQDTKARLQPRYDDPSSEDILYFYSGITGHGDLLKNQVLQQTMDGRQDVLRSLLPLAALGDLTAPP